MTWACGSDTPKKKLSPGFRPKFGLWTKVSMRRISGEKTDIDNFQCAFNTRNACRHPWNVRKGAIWKTTPSRSLIAWDDGLVMRRPYLVHRPNLGRKRGDWYLGNLVIRRLKLYKLYKLLIGYIVMCQKTSTEKIINNPLIRCHIYVGFVHAGIT